MNLADVTKIFEDNAAKATGMDKAMKFVLDQGTIHIDFSGDSPSVTNEDKEADCVITTSVETLDGIRTGKVNPMMAVMTGKVKIKGDMSLAMKLQQLFS
ncbi:MAG: SCP2 sterol-binding domain-containing protein [Saprospiraceae bacterium]